MGSKFFLDDLGLRERGGGHSNLGAFVVEIGRAKGRQGESSHDKQMMGMAFMGMKAMISGADFLRAPKDKADR